MRVMITGGGTGGHTSPAIAIIEELRARDPQLMLRWVGCPDSVEERVCAANDIPFRRVPVEGWPRAGLVKRLRALLRLGVGVVRSVMHIAAFRPQLVVGVGGYVSVPLTWVAQRMGIATVLHEQNMQLGMANQLLAPRAQRLLLSYPDTLGDYPKDRARVVGNPVRSGFYAAPSRAEACETLGLDPNIPVVFVCGGSQGARTLNAAMTDILSTVEKSEFQFVWMTGKQDVAAGREAAEGSAVPVQVYAFVDDMVSACAAATLIVSRAGASSTAEIAAVGRASILVPYPHATDDHQVENARAIEAAGAARVLLDPDCDGATLLEHVRALCADPSTIAAMEHAAREFAQPAAVETIADDLLAQVFERSPGTGEET